MELYLPGYCYCFDTSSLIDLKPYYPEVFSSLWKNLERDIADGRIIAPREVFDELEEKDDQIFEWAGKNRKMFIELDQDQLYHATEILKKYPGLVDPNKTIPDADPFVVALAISRSAKVVAQEKVSRDMNKPKIPNACQNYQIEFMNLKEFFVERGWKF